MESMVICYSSGNFVGSIGRKRCLADGRYGFHLISSRLGNLIFRGVVKAWKYWYNKTANHKETVYIFKRVFLSALCFIYVTFNSLAQDHADD